MPPLPVLDKATATLRRLMGREREQATRARYDPQPDPRGHAELAWGGTQIFGGMVLDDYNPDLMGAAAMRTADKMRRTLAQVRGVTKAVTLPILSTRWYLEEPKGAGSAEKEAAELLRENLFGGMEHSWDALLREACLAIYFGFRVPEIVWEERAGLIAIRKIASRNPELVERWLYHPNGELAGYLYCGDRPVGEGLDNWGASTVVNQQIPIPIEKTLLFSYDAENENPQGLGLWRSQYPHWYFVSALYKILGVGVERNLLGVPVGKRNSEAQSDDGAKMLSILRRLRAAEDAAVVLPHGWDLEWFESQRNLMDAMPLVEHHLRMIALSALAQFLNLGMSGTGTQALGSVHAQLFEQAEDANAKWIREAIEQQLIRRWCLLNYGPHLKPPRLLHRPIRSHDLQAWANGLNTLASGGFLHPTPDDEAKLRDEFELPEVAKEQLLSGVQPVENQRGGGRPHPPSPPLRRREGGMAPPAPNSGGTATVENQRGGGDTGGLGFAEADPGPEVGMSPEREARGRLEGDFGSRAGAMLEGLQSAYLKDLRPLVEQAQQHRGSGAETALPDLATVEVPGAARYEAFVRGYLREIFDLGRRTLAEETGEDLDAEPISERLQSWIRARAAVIAADHVAQLRTAVLTRVLTGIRAELEPEAIFSDAGATAIEALSRSTTRDFGATAAELVALVSAEAGGFPVDLAGWEFHQPGKHDQKSHGKGGRGGGHSDHDRYQIPEDHDLNEITVTGDDGKRVDLEKLARSGMRYADTRQGRWMSALNPEEKKAVAYWSTDSYKVLNRDVRNGVPLQEVRHAPELEAAVNKAQTDRAILVYRTFRGGFLEADFDAGKLQGAHIPDRGFSGTSHTKPAFTHGVIASIEVPSGFPAAALEKISQHGREREILLPRNTVFEVTHTWTNHKDQRRIHGKIREMTEFEKSQE